MFDPSVIGLENPSLAILEFDSWIYPVFLKASAFRLWRRGEVSPRISSEAWRIQKGVPWRSKGDWRRDVVMQ